MSRAGRLVVLLVLTAVVAGCGGSKKTTTTATTPQLKKTAIRVYLLLQGKVQPVRREVTTTAAATTTAVGNAAFAALVRGPSQAEADLGFKTAVPSAAVWAIGRVAGGALSLDTDTLPAPALAQAVYTLTEFPSSRVVFVNDKRYTRADFEDETPAILVESPLPFQKVKSPVRATGTANTFEATFQYDLVDPDGKVVKTHFVTATSGTGTRGTFDFTVPFTVGRDGLGKLVVYELSAADGSRIHVVEIPIRLMR